MTLYRMLPDVLAANIAAIGGAPATLRLRRYPKWGSDKPLIQLSGKWLYFVFDFQPTPRSVDKICNPTVGPSFGWKVPGLVLKYVPIAYPSDDNQNLVNVLTTLNGFGLIQSIPMLVPPLPTVKFAARTAALKVKYDAYRLSHPWLVHEMHGQKSMGDGYKVYNLTQKLYLPILGGPWWLPMEQLERV